MPAPKLLKELSARHVMTLTLNRPDVGNACDPDVLAALASSLDDAAADPSVRVVVLRGAGTHFCSGADVNATWSDEAIRFPQICKRLDNFLKPIVAIIQGGCVGGGVGFAACCDIVLAEDAAFFAVPELRIGVAPGALMLYLARVMGASNLRRYLLTGERFSAVDARQYGIVHIVAIRSQLETTASAIVDGLLLAAPQAAAKAKAALARYGAAPIDDAAISAMETLFCEHLTGAEASEGRDSFKEKRRPNWYPRQSGKKAQ